MLINFGMMMVGVVVGIIIIEVFKEVGVMVVIFFFGEVVVGGMVVELVEVIKVDD